MQKPSASRQHAVDCSPSRTTCWPGPNDLMSMGNEPIASTSSSSIADVVRSRRMRDSRVEFEINSSLQSGCSRAAPSGNPPAKNDPQSVWFQQKLRTSDPLPCDCCSQEIVNEADPQPKTIDPVVPGT